MESAARRRTDLSGVVPGATSKWCCSANWKILRDRRSTRGDADQLLNLRFDADVITAYSIRNAVKERTLNRAPDFIRVELAENEG